MFIEADNSELQEQWSFNLQPKQLFAKLKQLKPKEIFPNKEKKQKAVQAKKSVR